MPKTNGSQFQIHWIGGRPMFRKRPLHDKCEELFVILDSGMEWNGKISSRLGTRLFNIWKGAQGSVSCPFVTLFRSIASSLPADIATLRTKFSVYWPPCDQRIILLGSICLFSKFVSNCQSCWRLWDMTSWCSLCQIWLIWYREYNCVHWPPYDGGVPLAGRWNRDKAVN